MIKLFQPSNSKSVCLSLVLALVFSFNLLFAQSNNPVPDSVKTESAALWRKKFKVPGMLITAGLIASTDNEIFDREETWEARNKLAPNFQLHIDDYLQYAPVAVVYGLNAFGLKGKNDFRNRTVLLLKSELIMLATVIPLKTLTAVPRPDTRSRNSLPSGHTAEAFVAATFLHKEYGSKYPMISILGYTAATGVGLLRVMNNRHWMSDVIVGAGIGILSTNIAYMTHRPLKGRRKSRRDSLSVYPVYSGGAYGLSFSARL